MIKNEKIIRDYIRCIIIVLLSYTIGICTGYFTRSKKAGHETAELKARVEQLQSELDQRIRETEQFQEQLSGIKSDINDAIELSDRSRFYCESISSTISDINVTNGGITELLKRLDCNQRAIKQYCTGLQEENRKLREQLTTIQGSIDQQ